MKQMNNTRKKYLLKDKEKSFTIYSYSDLIKLLNSIPKESHLKFLYNNRNVINNLLYEEDKVLKLDNKVISNNNYMSEKYRYY